MNKGKAIIWSANKRAAVDDMIESCRSPAIRFLIRCRNVPDDMPDTMNDSQLGNVPDKTDLTKMPIVTRAPSARLGREQSLKNGWDRNLGSKSISR
jgi:hypothetical protein